MRKLWSALGVAVIVMVLLALAYTLGRHDARAIGRSASPDSSAATPLSDADVLFLEALRRGYALDDLVVRRQLVRRLRDALIQEHPIAEPDDATLDAWLRQHADRYQVPARYSFDQVYLSRAQHGAHLSQAATALAAQLQAAPDDTRQLGDPFPRGKHLERLDSVQIEADFGRALAHEIARLPRAQWQGPLTSPLGLHFIRVTAVEAARLPTLDEARARLQIDFREAQQQQAVRDALLQLRAKFTGAASLPAPAPMHDEDLP